MNHTPAEWACLAAFAVGIPGLIALAVAASREGARAAAAHAAEQRACEGCYAGPGEPCGPACLGPVTA